MNVYPPTLPSIQTAVMGAQGGFNPTWYKYLSDLRDRLTSFPPLDLKQNFGARMDGSDDTGPYQNAINYLVQNGGGVLSIPNGMLSTQSITVPSTAPPIYIYGQGTSTVHVRRGGLPAGKGLLDLFDSNLTLSNMVLDGATMTPVGMQYNKDFPGVSGASDPYSASLTTNSTVWVHGGASNLSFEFIRFQHAGGYSLLLDATQSVVSDVHLDRCQFFNNRPTLFGTTPGQLVYGSWNGGIFAKGDGRTANSGVVRGLLVSRCHFERNTGNCLWSHNWGLNALNEDFRFTDNYFLDCGLDGILCGVATSGVVKGNVFRRIGYTTINDTSRSVPRWLQGLNATGLDSSGLVLNIIYVDNSFLNVNGGCIDLDSHGQSVIGNNVMRISTPDDPAYDEDQVAISGAGNAGSTSYGINLSNTSNTALGAANMKIGNNEIANMKEGAIRLYAARRVNVRGNGIVAPADSAIAPITMGPIGAGPNQRCYDNKIVGNDIDYNPATGAPCIVEDDTYSQFLSSEVNTVCANVPITPQGTLATEFQKSPHSGSPTYSEQVWF